MLMVSKRVISVITQMKTSKNLLIHPRKMLQFLFIYCLFCVCSLAI